MSLSIELTAILALHLEGNIREYIGRQIGGIAYQRERPFEFSATATATATDPRYRAATARERSASL